LRQRATYPKKQGPKSPGPKKHTRVSRYRKSTCGGWEERAANQYKRKQPAGDAPAEEKRSLRKKIHSRHCRRRNEEMGESSQGNFIQRVPSLTCVAVMKWFRLTEATVDKKRICVEKYPERSPTKMSPASRRKGERDELEREIGG